MLFAQKPGYFGLTAAYGQEKVRRSVGHVWRRSSQRRRTVHRGGLRFEGVSWNYQTFGRRHPPQEFKFCFSYRYCIPMAHNRVRTGAGQAVRGIYFQNSLVLQIPT